MNVKIDYDACMGDGNCVKVCPEMFRYDDDKLVAVVKTADVPPGLEDKVRRAAAECNVDAVVIEE